MYSTQISFNIFEAKQNLSAIVCFNCSVRIKCAGRQKYKVLHYSHYMASAASPKLCPRMKILALIVTVRLVNKWTQSGFCFSRSGKPDAANSILKIIYYTQS